MRRLLNKTAAWGIGLAACSLIATSYAQDAGPAPAREPGTVKVPGFDLPPSDFLSPEARAFQVQMATAAGAGGGDMAGGGGSIEQIRGVMEKHLAPRVAAMQAKYPVDVAEQRIAGVRTRVFTPRGGKPDPTRVLINLHGGAFQMCAEACAYLESIPVAALGNYKVVSVDYRQGPEAVFPAASEDVAAVYRELIKTYKPQSVGMYGCSAGGMLTAQATAWFKSHGMPMPGAIGIFGAGAVRMGAGDSAHIAPALGGTIPVARPTGAVASKAPPRPRTYFDGANMNDPLVSPAGDAKNLAGWPPALVITGTRAMDLSGAVFTHTQLLKADVPASLIVGEGMGHCYIYFAQLPEALDAHREIAKFFRANLK